MWSVAELQQVREEKKACKNESASGTDSDKSRAMKEREFYRALVRLRATAGSLVCKMKAQKHESKQYVRSVRDEMRD